MLKNLYSKYRFFALFRRVMARRALGEKLERLGVDLRHFAALLGMKKTWHRVVTGLL